MKKIKLYNHVEYGKKYIGICVLRMILGAVVITNEQVIVRRFCATATESGKATHTMLSGRITDLH